MEKVSFFLIGLTIVGLLLESGRIVAGSGDPWCDFKSLELLDGEGFKRVIDPLVQMTANAYRYPAVIPVQNWTLVDAVAPIQGGMHAVVYKDDCDTVRMVLAFRGTDVSGSESSRADVCADSVLWVDSDVSVLDPQNCSEFSSDTLDYYKQAVDYTRQMLEAYPQTSFLLTGHSLGAGLAILMSATFGSNPLLPVVAFSSPGTKATLERFGLKLTSDHDENLYIIADKWDEVMRTSWKDQIGTLCLYKTNITTDCLACFEATGAFEDFSTIIAFPPTPSRTPSSTLTDEDCTEQHPVTEVDPDEAPCTNCFFETHYLKHVIDLVELGNKPVCESEVFRNIQFVSTFGEHHL